VISMSPSAVSAVKALSALSLQSSAVSGYSNGSCNGSFNGSHRTASGYDIADIAPAANQVNGMNVGDEEYPDIPSDPELDADGHQSIYHHGLSHDISHDPGCDEEEKLDRDPSTRAISTASIPPGNPVFHSLQSQIEERDQRILELEQENEALRKFVAQIQQSRKRLDSMSYKKWTAEQIASWISKLDDGIFAHFYAKLCDRLKEDGVEGSDLRDINTHQDWKRYGITKLVLRKKLIQHVSDLIDTEMYHHPDGGGQVTAQVNMNQVSNPTDEMEAIVEMDEDAMAPGTFDEGQVSGLTGNSSAFKPYVRPSKRRMTPYGAPYM